MTIRRIIMGALFVLGATGTAAADADLAAGEEIYQDVCRACHGPNAGGMASFPQLSDKSEEYLVGRLEEYRAGEQVGPNSPLMWPVAADLSDADIVNIAAYIDDIE